MKSTSLQRGAKGWYCIIRAERGERGEKGVGAWGWGGVARVAEHGLGRPQEQPQAPVINLVPRVVLLSSTLHQRSRVGWGTCW